MTTLGLANIIWLSGSSWILEPIKFLPWSVSFAACYSFPLRYARLGIACMQLTYGGLTVQLLQGKLSSATQLLRNGKKILIQLQTSRSRLRPYSTISMRELHAVLELLFMRLDFQLITVRKFPSRKPFLCFLNTH